VVRALNIVFKNRLSWVLLAACFFIALILQSRAFSLGMMVGVVYFWQRKRVGKTSLNQWAFIGVLFILLLISSIFFIKSDSSEGRLLIYKISFSMLKTHWPTGIGLGNFHSQYLYYQAAYFKKAHYTTKELLLADNTYYVFNDYYQLVIETGVIGLGIVAASLTWAFWFIFIRPLTFSFISTLCTSLIIAILVAAAFTHVFERSYMQLALILLSLPLVWERFREKKYRAFACSMVVLITVLWFKINFYSNILQYQAYNTFKDAKKMAEMGYHRRALQMLDSISNKLASNAEFQCYYAGKLLYSDPKKSLDILKRVSLAEPNSRILNQIGDSYCYLADFDSAESAYQTAINMVPNRFKSKYALFELYWTNHRYGKAKICGKLILKQPVKIPSVFIDHIKMDVKNKLDSLARMPI
jgi:tetratricopeptide (TPR) repeat protein